MMAKHAIPKFFQNEVRHIATIPCVGYKLFFEDEPNKIITLIAFALYEEINKVHTNIEHLVCPVTLDEVVHPDREYLFILPDGKVEDPFANETWDTLEAYKEYLESL